MSIFKATFPSGVIDQLKARQDKMLDRDTTSVKYLNSRTAWIRMTSAVNVKGSDSLAKNNILLGGALYNSSTARTGVGSSGTNAYSTKTPSGTDHRLGLRPMPGITGIEVKNKGAYGSLREITVSFNCWDIKQLEELELLYMRPGYSVLVEWGWIPYLSNNKTLSNAVDFTDDVLNDVGTKEDIWKKIFQKASKDGNYDAIYGFIKNYSWKARADGGYDCTTNQLNKSYSQNKLAGMLNEIWQIAVNDTGIANLGRGTIDLNGLSCEIFRYDLTVEGRDASVVKDSFVEEDQQIYITLKTFCALMNKYILIEDSKAKTPLAAISVSEGEHNGSGAKDPLYCLAHRYQLSTDPTVCIIRNDGWKTPEASFGIITDGTDTETIVKIMSSGILDYFKDSDKGLGIIGNIYVNLGYLYGLIVSDDLSSQDSKEKKEISLYDYIKNIMSGVSTAIGNVATFELFIDPVDSVGRIIDVNFAEDVKGREEIAKNAFPLQVHNLKSTVRSYSLESQIFPDQSTTIAIGAQVEGGALGSDSNTMIEFNEGLVDRIVPKKVAPGTNTNDEEAKKEKNKSFKTSLAVILSYINKTDPSWYEHAGDFDVSDSSKYANALKDIIQYDRSIIKDESKNKSIIPTKLSLEMDGIGGIIIGNIFRMNEDILPNGYKGGNGVGADIGFVVNEIGASVNGNDWVTKIGAQFIILDEPSGVDSSVYNNIKNDVVKTVQKIEDEKEAVNKVDEIIKKVKKTTTNTAKRSSNANCKEKYNVITPTNAPGVIVPDKPSWASIKKTFPIIQGGVPVTAIGTPLDAGSDFYFKMSQTRVSKRLSPVNYIVIHYTVSEFDDPTYHYQHTWNRVTDKPASADFTIGRTGKIAGFKSFKTYKSWHFGEATWPRGVNFNNESIGFELESTGYAYYCKTNNKFYTNGHKELNPKEVALTPTYRGFNLWHYHTDVQISATANLIIALYNSGIISDKTKFLAGCTGTNRYSTLFPEKGLRTKPAPGVITHGTGRDGKFDTFPQKNLLAMLDDLPNLIKSTPKSYIAWKNTL